MFEGMLAAITKPKPFFEQLTNDDVLVSRALWVVLLVCVVAAGAGYFSALPLASVMGDNSIIAVTAVLGGTLGLAAYYVLGLAYHRLAHSYGGGHQHQALGHYGLRHVTSAHHLYSIYHFSCYLPRHPARIESGYDHGPQRL